MNITSPADYISPTIFLKKSNVKSSGTSIAHGIETLKKILSTSEILSRISMFQNLLVF